jgi:hypothetical protein
VVYGFRFQNRAQYETGWAIRGKWRIRDGKCESGLFSFSEI